MALKYVILVVFLVASVVCKPRDSTAVHANNVIVQDHDSQISDKVETSTRTEHKATQVPGRISCEHDEATEDDVCLQHCVPKGYSYGLCISRTCSCI